MTNRIGWIALFVLAVACSKDKQDGKKDDKPAGADQGTAAAPTVTLADLFVGNKPAMPEHVGKLRFGMPEAEAKAAHPEVFEAKYGYNPPGLGRVETNVQIEKGRVYQTRMQIKEPIDVVKKTVESKWGPPSFETKNSIGSPQIYWDNPEAGVRMKLEKYADTSSMVRFDPVMSVEAVLGSDPKTFGFEKIPLIGATQEDVMKAFDVYRPSVRENDPGSITFMTHNVAGTERAVHLDLRVKEGKVTGYHVSFPPELHDKVVPRLEQMFGPGKLDSMKLYTDFKGPPPVKAQIRNENGYGTSMWVGDTKKK